MVRGKQGSEPSASVDTGERRSSTGHRVHFEALVAVGGATGGNGFEAESVNVSAEGMRLRTAYLPAVGDRLVFRFDGLDGEAIVEGEVIWATEQQKGGEFAVRFLDLDDETREMLKELCFAESQGLSEEKAEDRSMAGTRVRLHIEGLGSPMKARVRSGGDRELSVGSSLEFLKLGRPVELEDVDRQKKREGFVDSVKVEVDPESSVPQLVVSLRFDAQLAPEAKPAAQKIEAPKSESPKTKPGVGPMPEKTTEKAEPLAASEAAPAAKVMESEVPGTVRARDTQEDDAELDFGKSKLRVAGEKAKALTNQAASKIVPAISGFGTSARSMWGKVQSGFAKRRGQLDEARRENAPRRVTAPPPSGALKSSGRKVVREENSEMEPDSIQIPKNSTKRALVGGVVGLALIGGIFGVVKASSGSAEQKKTAATHVESEAKTLPPIPNGPAVGNVPLYGATPLSTTEQIPEPAPVASAAPSAQPAAKVADENGDDEKPSTETVREWGHGEVGKAKTIHIKMDGKVAGITGEEVDGGFVIHVPNHKSKSTNSGLARKDKRLSSFDVVNHENETDITVKFKGDVPGYLAKVKDDKIDIQIGGEGAKTTAKAGTKKKGTKKHH